MKISTIICAALLSISQLSAFGQDQAAVAGQLTTQEDTLSLELDQNSLAFARELMTSTAKNDPELFKKIIEEMEANNAKVLEEMAQFATEEELANMKKLLYAESEVLSQSLVIPEE